MLSHRPDPVYNSDLYKKTLHQAYEQQQKVWPWIQKLNSENDVHKRKELFAKSCQLNEDFLINFLHLLKVRIRHAKEKGFESVFHYFLSSEFKYLNWLHLYRNHKLQSSIQTYAKNYIQNRKTNLDQNTFCIWDFWLQSEREKNFNLHLITLNENYQDLEIGEKFLDEIGFHSVFSKIEWIENKNVTHARIDFDAKQNLKTSIFIAESSVGSRKGSLGYLSALSHEMGHVVQAWSQQDPKRETILPPFPLTEVISMFFEKLFLTKHFLNHFFQISEEEFYKVSKRIQFDQQETLARLLSYVDFEMNLYQTLSDHEITAEEISELWIETQRKYFGFEDFPEQDHSWQSKAMYMIASPFYQRSYLIGDIFSQRIIRRFEEQISNLKNKKDRQEYIQEIVTNCSNQGSMNTWQDFEKVANIAYSSTNTYSQDIAHILSQDIPQI